MSRPISPTELRANLYRILDEVLETGLPREIVKGGKRLAIVSLTPTPWKIEDLPRRTAITCTPEELIDTHWEYVPDDELLR